MKRLFKKRKRGIGTVTVSAKVIRANGKVEDLGVIGKAEMQMKPQKG